jgi:hypothetical protein
LLKRHRTDAWTLYYYSFLAKYGREPVDLLDFIEGVVVAGLLDEIDRKSRGIK